MPGQQDKYHITFGYRLGANFVHSDVGFRCLGFQTGMCASLTLTSHIRRLLDSEFASSRVYESPKQFMSRLQKVEDHLNSENFAAPDGGGLWVLAKEMFGRCQQVIDLKGERIPK